MYEYDHLQGTAKFQIFYEEILNAFHLTPIWEQIMYAEIGAVTGYFHKIIESWNTEKEVHC